MGIMRWAFYNALKEQYEPAIPVSMTYGYLTKNTRIEHGLLKEHYIDARCISGNPDAVSDGTYYYQKKVRCHNRQIHKQTILKGGIRKSNQAEYLVKGYRLFDKVSYQGREYFIFGRRKTGFFDIRTLSGEKVRKGSISVKKLTFADTRKNYLIERIISGYLLKQYGYNGKGDDIVAAHYLHNKGVLKCVVPDPYPVSKEGLERKATLGKNRGKCSKENASNR